MKCMKEIIIVFTLISLSGVTSTMPPNIMRQVLRFKTFSNVECGVLWPIFRVSNWRSRAAFVVSDQTIMICKLVLDCCYNSGQWDDNKSSGFTDLLMQVLPFPRSTPLFLYFYLDSTFCHPFLHNFCIMSIFFCINGP